MKATAFDFFERHHLKLLFRLPFNSHSGNTTKPKTTQIQAKYDNAELETMLQKFCGLDEFD
jgi:hypothetical protein